MSVRKCTGRKAIGPVGKDYKDILNKGKAFYRGRDFEMQPRDFGNGTVWSAETTTLSPFKAPEGTILIKRIEKGWEEVR